jgi:hypothetical protein
MIGTEFMSGIASNTAGGLLAVHNGQLNVHQYEVRASLGDRCNRLFPIFGLSQLVARVAKQIAQDLPVIFLVFDYKDALTHETRIFAQLASEQ